MAKTTTVHITDDLDCARDAIAVAFIFSRVNYTIDLSKKNLAAFEKALKPYLDAATKVGRSGPGRRSKTGAVGTPRGDSAAIRTWAEGQGIEVSSRGRIPASVVEQHRSAH